MKRVKKMIHLDAGDTEDRIDAMGLERSHQGLPPRHACHIAAFHPTDYMASLS